MDKFGRSRDAVKRKACDLGIKFTGSNPTKRSNLEYDELLINSGIEYLRIEDYINNRTPILHKCKYGHIWKVRPDSILRLKTGCPSCTNYGFDPLKPAILYLVYINDYNVYKLGVSNKSNPLDRFPKRDSDLMEIKWVIKYSKGVEAKEAEKFLQQKYAMNRIHLGNVLESGNSECFSEYISQEFIL
jgi:hypothetical protein